MPSDARERMAEAIEEEMYEYADVFERALSTFTWNQGDVLVAKKEAVDNIIAHLWRMADRPEVVAAVARNITASVWGHDFDELDEDSREALIDEAYQPIDDVLTALLGPRPTEQETSDV